MLRGSAELLQKSVRHFIPIVEAIAGIPPTLWEVDADRYTESNIDGLLEQASTIRGASNGGMSDILVTKIMLGVFGSVPAFDTYFKRGFQISMFGQKALRKVGAFYRDNAEVIERYRVPTLDFLNGSDTHHRYTRAKVIDMAFLSRAWISIGPSILLMFETTVTAPFSG